MPNTRQYVTPARRARITRTDIEQVGITPGCPGCKCTLRRGVEREHTEECRKRIEDALIAAGNAKVISAQIRILERAAETLEENEEVEAKRVKVKEEQ